MFPNKTGATSYKSKASHASQNCRELTILFATSQNAPESTTKKEGRGFKSYFRGNQLIEESPEEKAGTKHF